MQVQGYKVFCKNKVKRSKFGRAPGGIAICVKDNIKCEVIETPTKCNDVMWVLLNGEEEIIIGATYNHPVNSKFTNEHFFEELEEEVGYLDVNYAGTKRVIVGDFNARTGTQMEWELTPRRKYGETEIEREIQLDSRNNQDKEINTAGRRLINFL